MDLQETVRTAGIVNDSIVDGPGLRLTLFVQGCPHNCEGCHNPQTHDFSGGEYKTAAEIIDAAVSNPLLDGVTFSGGEPFCQAGVLARMGRELKNRGMNIITYTGFVFETLLEKADSENCYRELIDVSDYIIDGPYVHSLRDLTLKFRGSTNQRIIDVKSSLEQGRTVIADI